MRIFLGCLLLSDLAEWIKPTEGMPATFAAQLANSRQPRESKRTVTFNLLTVTFGTVHLVQSEEMPEMERL
jgi:hypothetical protein